MTQLKNSSLLLYMLAKLLLLLLVLIRDKLGFGGGSAMRTTYFSGTTRSGTTPDLM